MDDLSDAAAQPMQRKAEPSSQPEPSGLGQGEAVCDAYPSGRIIILGFTGSLGSGCTFLAEGIKEVYGRDAHYYHLSRYIRDSLEAAGDHSPSIAQLQDEGNRLRKENGLSYLVDRCIKEVVSKEKPGVYNERSIILIDSIRNSGEVQSLRVIPNFYLVAVHASEETRAERLVGVGKGKCFATREEFETADERDLAEEGIPWGQQVQSCSDMADIIVSNETKLPENTLSRSHFFRRFVNDYIPVMMALRDGETLTDRAPSVDEALMTMAFCASLRSSCAKRKVGAVVAQIKQFPEVTSHMKRKEDDKRYHVLASGYNEVPLGTAPCRLGEHETCFRDHLKRVFAEGFRHCPKCGRGIPDDLVGRYERLRRHKCDCGARMRDFLPGSGDATGRLLDMCKALHAEESAILGLSAIPRGGGGKLVLYTTTFPCNLCANKIVEAGIDEVVYAEPYPMREAWSILEHGGVRPRKFEGIKGNAYFRMYS